MTISPWINTMKSTWQLSNHTIRQVVKSLFMAYMYKLYVAHVLWPFIIFWIIKPETGQLAHSVCIVFLCLDPEQLSIHLHLSLCAYDCLPIPHSCIYVVTFLYTHYTPLWFTNFFSPNCTHPFQITDILLFRSGSWKAPRAKSWINPL